MKPAARRMAAIQPFHVMALLERARRLEAEGRSIVHMEIGEPDFPSPREVIAAGISALQAKRTHYTASGGLPELRAAIAGSYAEKERPNARRVIVTPGSSGALQLVFGTLIDPGDEVLMADPTYPCNRHFVRLFEGNAKLVPVGPETAYQLTADLIKRNWGERSRAVMIASPSNPTGTVVEEAELERIVATVAELGGVLVVDEIYHGLVYGAPAPSVLKFSQDAFVVNSFSKYYGMTGWRVGWLVTPEQYVADVEKLAQNIFLAASTPAQYAALAVFTPEVQRELLRRSDVFRERRDYLLPALRDIGFDIPVTPQGAFYIYADCTRFTDNSLEFSNRLLEEAGVAITPGLDFGSNRPEAHVRFSYANTMENLQEAVGRIDRFLGHGNMR